MATLVEQIQQIKLQTLSNLSLINGSRDKGLLYTYLGDVNVFGCKVTATSAYAFTVNDDDHVNPYKVTPAQRVEEYPNVALVYGEGFLLENSTHAIDATALPSSGYSRSDIVYIYVGDNGSTIGVAEGTSSAGSPVDPTIPSGSMPIARLNINDTGITSVDDLRDFVGRIANTKADIASPAFTGNPTAPTPSAGDNDTSVANTEFVQNELNNQFGNVDNTSDLDKPISTATQSALDGKVDDAQVLTNVPAGAVFTDTTYSIGNGGLTEYNFTASLNSKLAGIEAGANNYTFPYTVSPNEGINTVVQRNSSGYLHASYFNGTGTFSTSGGTSGMGLFTGTNGTDTYGRSYTAAAARALLNVENGATADQTASEILTAIKTVDGSGSGLDADLLDGLGSDKFLRTDTGDSVSGGVTTFYNTAGATIATASSSRLEILQPTPGADAVMTFHVANDFACYFGLNGGTNRLACGGWSMGASSYDVALMNITNYGNFTASGDVTANLFKTSYSAASSISETANFLVRNSVSDNSIRPVTANALTDWLRLYWHHKSIGTTGYLHLPGRMLLQWGYSTNATITYPLAFTSVYHVSANPHIPGGLANDILVAAAITNSFNHQFTLTERYIIGTNAVGVGTDPMHWIALGHY